MKPTFSVVTITYNRAHLIGETIQSVLNQTYKNFEYIIIDDGSTDNTEQIVTNFNDKRIKYFKYKKCGQLSVLRNNGFKKANGNFISIIDSDDIWKEEKLELINNVINKYNNIKFIIHNVSFIYKNKHNNIGYLNYKNDFNKEILNSIFYNKILTYPVYTFSKDILKQIGFFDVNMLDGQHDFYLRVAAQYKIYYIAKNLTLMKKHANNMSNVFDISVFDEYFETIKKLKADNLITKIKYGKLKTFIYFKLGLANKEINKKESKKYILKAFKSKPFSYIGIKSLLYYFNLL